MLKTWFYVERLGYIWTLYIGNWSFAIGARHNAPREGRARRAAKAFKLGLTDNAAIWYAAHK